MLLYPLSRADWIIRGQGWSEMGHCIVWEYVPMLLLACTLSEVPAASCCKASADSIKLAAYHSGEQGSDITGKSWASGTLGPCFAFIAALFGQLHAPDACCAVETAQSCRSRCDVFLPATGLVAKALVPKPQLLPKARPRLHPDLLVWVPPLLDSLLWAWAANRAHLAQPLQQGQGKPATGQMSR